MWFISQMFVDTWPLHLILFLPQTPSTQLCRMSLYAVSLQLSQPRWTLLGWTETTDCTPQSSSNDIRAWTVAEQTQIPPSHVPISIEKPSWGVEVIIPVKQDWREVVVQQLRHQVPTNIWPYSLSGIFHMIILSSWSLNLSRFQKL